MIFSLLTGGLCLILIGGGVGYFVYSAGKNKRYPDYKTKKKRIFAIVAAAVGAVMLLTIPASFHTVEAGEAAVVKRLGVITNVERPGTYFDFSLTDTYELYDTKVQQIEIATSAYTKDSQPMDIALAIQFQIRQDHLTEIALNYGSLSALTDRIQRIAIERTKATLSRYQAEELISSRDQISPAVNEEIKNEISDKFYVDFNSAVLTDITFSDAFESAVEAKMKAQQEKLQAEYENEKSREKAETALYVAEQEAKALIAKAEAEAAANIAAAEAEARGITLKSVEIARMLGYTVTESTDAENGTTYEITFDAEHTGKSIAEYLQYIEYLSKWDGELPEVVTSDSGVLINIPTGVS